MRMRMMRSFLRLYVRKTHCEPSLSVKLLLLALLSLSNPHFAHTEGIGRKYLTFDSGSDRTLTGWTYFSDIDESGNAGFREDKTTRLFKWYAWDWNQGPDYGFLEIDNGRGALGTRGSLKFTITGGKNVDTEIINGGQITNKETFEANPALVGTGIGGSLFSFFMNGGYQVPQASGANRFSLYLYVPNGWTQFRDPYGNWSPHDLHLTQNHCDPAQNPCTSPRGSISEGEPTNGQSGHFYHYLKIAKGGGWVHVLLDQHPQKERQDMWDLDDNPTSRDATYGFKNYYDTLATFYIDGQVQIPTLFNIWLDEMEFYHTSTTSEPNQNDDTIASVTVGYFPESNGDWGIGFMGDDDQVGGTWEIRYSTSPITNANFSAATLITPLSNGVPGSPGRVRRLEYEAGYPAVWTDFDLPAALEVPGSRIYFAIKDVSQLGEHATPTRDPDRRTSKNSNIHTIEYFVPASSHPERFNGSPTGTLPSGTTQTTLSLTTAENATCRYAITAGTAYSSMPNTFLTTGQKTHSTLLSGLQNSRTYSYYMRCQDAAGNANTDDFKITFSVASSIASSPHVPMPSHNWVQLHDGSGAEKLLAPSARILSSATWDSYDRLMIYHGGYFNDESRIDRGVNSTSLWAFDPFTRSWSQWWNDGSVVAPVDGGTGIPRRRHVYGGLDYMPDRRSLLFYGGISHPGDLGDQTDTWEFEVTTKKWIQRFPSANPAGRLETDIVYHPLARKAIIYGGLTSTASETWLYDPATLRWTRMDPSSHPDSLIDHVMVYDSKRNRIVLFGGCSDYETGGQDDLWAYDISTDAWTKIPIPGAKPPERWRHGFAYDSVNDIFLVYGGDNANGPLHDTWVYNPRTNAWMQIVTPTVPTFHTVEWRLVYSPEYNLFLMVIPAGESYPSDQIAETWAFRYAQ